MPETNESVYYDWAIELVYWHADKTIPTLIALRDTLTELLEASEEWERIGLGAAQKKAHALLDGMT